MDSARTKTVVIFMGIPASGKSTYYRLHFKDEYKHINLDTLRTRNKERALIEACFARGKSFVVDNTNPSRIDRQRYIPVAKAAGYRVEGYFFQSRTPDCMARNALRKGREKVPDKAVASISNKLEMPAKPEGFDAIYFVSIKDGAFITEHWKDELP